MNLFMDFTGILRGSPGHRQGPSGSVSGFGPLREYEDSSAGVFVFFVLLLSFEPFNACFCVSAGTFFFGGSVSLLQRLSRDPFSIVFRDR